MKPDTNPKPAVTLEQLLRRGDVWRGQSRRFVPQPALDTGYAALNAALLHKGWPLGSLIEVCQPSSCGNSEWLLLTPSLLRTQSDYIVLLNPPALPFAQGLIQAGIALERLLVVQAENKADFLASFVELTRTPACEALLAWQPKQTLTYTDLRKCLLATGDSHGLYVLFRHADHQVQSSPASLRLAVELHGTHLEINIFKQKGMLAKNPLRSLQLPLPESWQALAPHRQSDQTAEGNPLQPQRKDQP